jgi:PIN domain nuclease of toxin-antitoxin system
VLLLLDTHVWVWSVEGDAGRTGRRARAVLGRAEAGEAIRVSPVSIFELAALHTVGRVRLARPIEQWVREALGAAGVRVAELAPGTALDAGAIPRTALPDPLDRLLVASARQLDAALMTGDARILAYAKETGAVRAVDARR